MTQHDRIKRHYNYVVHDPTEYKFRAMSDSIKKQPYVASSIAKYNWIDPCFPNSETLIGRCSTMTEKKLKVSAEKRAESDFSTAYGSFVT